MAIAPSVACLRGETSFSRACIAMGVGVWLAFVGGLAGCSSVSPASSSDDASARDSDTSRRVPLDALEGAYRLKLTEQNSTCSSSRSETRRSSPSSPSRSNSRETSEAVEDESYSRHLRLERLRRSTDPDRPPTSTVARETQTSPTDEKAPERLVATWCKTPCSSEHAPSFQLKRIGPASWRSRHVGAQVESDRRWIRQCRFEHTEIHLRLRNGKIQLERTRLEGRVTLEGTGTCRASQTSRFVDKLECRGRDIWQGRRVGETSQSIETNQSS